MPLRPRRLALGSLIVLAAAAAGAQQPTPAAQGAKQLFGSLAEANQWQAVWDDIPAGVAESAPL